VLLVVGEHQPVGGRNIRLMGLREFSVLGYFASLAFAKNKITPNKTEIAIVPMAPDNRAAARERAAVGVSRK
jgi:hypothetical protein